MTVLLGWFDLFVATEVEGRAERCTLGLHPLCQHNFWHIQYGEALNIMPAK